MLENSEDAYLITFTLNKLLIVAFAITYFTECRRHLGVKNSLEGMKWEAINDTIPWAALHRNIALQGDAVAQAWSSAPRIPCLTIPPDRSKSGSYSVPVPKLRMLRFISLCRQRKP